VPLPFLVLATQNPIEQEGVYPLPEAQRDRFLMKIVVDYPTPAEEVEIVQRMGVTPPEPRESLSIEALGELQGVADSIFVAREVIDYAVSLVLATREPSRFGLADLKELVAYGASPRASLGLVAAGRAIALLRGRSYVLPQDVFDVAPDILRHRLVLSYEALARDISVDDVLGRLLSTVPAPRVTPSQDPSAGLPRPDHFGSTAAASATSDGVAPGPAPAGPSWGTHPDPAGPAVWGTDGRPAGSTGTDGGWPSTGR
jgi:MoxR-like ATPase